jgi:exopolysaccharide biosynthesis predicted pyruvyltransferase EpsI
VEVKITILLSQMLFHFLSDKSINTKREHGRFISKFNKNPKLFLERSTVKKSIAN